jgi:hypothetical protein
MSNLVDASAKDLLAIISNALTEQINNIYPNAVKDLTIDSNGKILTTAINQSKPLTNHIERNSVTNISKIGIKGLVV